MTEVRVTVRAIVSCPDCGKPMSRFLNPERYICSYPRHHEAVRVGDKHLNTGRSPGTKGRPRRR